MTNAIHSNNGRVSQAMTPAIAGLSLLMSIAFAFYTVSNPKGDVILVKAEAREDLRRVEDRIEQEMKVMRSTIELKLVPFTLHEEFARRIDKVSDTLRDEVNRIRADAVTRSEQQQHWVDIAERFVAIRDQGIQARKENIDTFAELRKELGGQYTLGDQIKNLQDQLKILSNRLDARVMDNNNHK